MRRILFALVAAAAIGSLAHAADATDAASLWPRLEPLYRDLHRHPELSLQETETAAKMSDRLSALGFEVTTGVGKLGVVGVLKNGAGPTLMIRTDMDALPVEEKTGLPYASTVTAKNAAGDTVPVMHACGHDVHMTSWIGTAMILAGDRASWHGTLVMIAQPAEELGRGAKAMLDDGLLTRFPRPDALLAIHDFDQLASGLVGLSPGPVFASSDSVDLVVYGRGGHGGRPATTIDPIVIASKIVVSLQTLVSRENDPFQPAVVTVGSFHAGTKHNIIPDSAKLQLSVRAYDPVVRKKLLDGIRRIAEAEAQAAMAPKPPDVAVVESVPLTVNDPALASRVVAALKRSLGADRVVDQVRVTAAEDVGTYHDAGVPTLDLQIGATPAAVLEKARKDGTTVPGIHSSLFAPDAKPAVTTAIESLVAAAREVFSGGK